MADHATPLTGPNRPELELELELELARGVIDPDRGPNRACERVRGRYGALFRSALPLITTAIGLRRLAAREIVLELRPLEADRLARGRRATPPQG